MAGLPALADILEEYQLVDAEDRYRLLIDLGRQLEPMPDALKTEATRVRGCSASVWLYPTASDGRLHFLADSNAAITKGIVALVLTAVQDKPAAEVAQTDSPNASRRSSSPSISARTARKACLHDRAGEGDRGAAGSGGLGGLPVFALFGLAKHVVSGLDLFEAFGGFGVAGVGVGMSFLDQPPVRRLDRREIGIAVETRAHRARASRRGCGCRRRARPFPLRRLAEADAPCSSSAARRAASSGLSPAK